MRMMSVSPAFAPPARPAVGFGADTPVDFQNRRIVMVEDNPSPLARLLQHANAQVELLKPQDDSAVNAIFKKLPLQANLYIVDISWGAQRENAGPALVEQLIRNGVDPNQIIFSSVTGGSELFQTRQVGPHTITMLAKTPSHGSHDDQVEAIYNRMFAASV